MNAILQDKINREIFSLVETHIHYINKLGIHASIEQPLKHNYIVNQIIYLANLSQSHPSKISKEEINRATEAIATIEYFLQMTNAYSSFFSNARELGRIYNEILIWHSLAIKPWAIPLPEVWDIIDPVQPDTIHDLGCNCFQAFWANPVPMMDIEMLVRTPRIIVLHNNIARQNVIRAGISVNFSINQLDEESE